jgi:hypothetical protein
MSPKATGDDTSLKRLPGEGWQTRDGRFTIETASGTWSLLDAEQTDDLGLPLVRGPFWSLAEAKAAIEAARASEPATSTLAGRAGKAGPADQRAAKSASRPAKAAEPGPAKTATPGPTKTTARKPRAEAEEPRWITELDAADRRRAHRLIARLMDLGVRDAVGVARRDLVGDVAAVARVATADRLAAVLDGADAAAGRLAEAVVGALVEGRDEGLDVRWRLVDDRGRPIGVSDDDVAAARKRRSARH